MRHLIALTVGVVMMSSVLPFAPAEAAQATITGRKYLRLSNAEKQIYVQLLLDQNRGSLSECARALPPEKVAEAMTTWIKARPKTHSDPAFFQLHRAVNAVCGD
ncbi:MAG: hypothetical protein QNJ94_12560 [Alphaproteobacteria bacterium]|nr:hypothetical protein [Alphaproteobacteria bacterium]